MVTRGLSPVRLDEVRSRIRLLAYGEQPYVVWWFSSVKIATSDWWASCQQEFVKNCSCVRDWRQPITVVKLQCLVLFFQSLNDCIILRNVHKVIGSSSNGNCSKMFCYSWDKKIKLTDALFYGWLKPIRFVHSWVCKGKYIKVKLWLD